uniref:Reverse transcriptase RNase H-like domain-containing protein n=1 Tax=Nicotiana tabacum TaxID=4097 RepID=A0A1S4B7X0_TOBAC
MRHPNSNEVRSFVDLVTDVIVDDASATMNVEDKLEAVLLNLDDDEKSDGYVECVNALQDASNKALNRIASYLGAKAIAPAPQAESTLEVLQRWKKKSVGLCDVAVGALLGQRINKIFHPVYYASKIMNDPQVNYTVTKNELLAIVFAMKKFQPYLMGTKVIVHTDHATLWYLMSKKDSKA